MHDVRVFKRRGSNNRGGDDSPGDVYEQLRAIALGAEGSGALPAASAEHPDVSGLVVDIPASGGTATVVAMTDNTTSLYTSTGGGIIGAGAHAAVATATQALLTSVQQQFDAFTTGDDGSLPAGGSVRFHVLSERGPRMVDVS
ncbi:MAG TPA: hypothetical protein VFR41_15715, partial [Acidimicrobiia bacterium]|nr:hypothetical protein [Acidimicrobiia bacterium]